MPLPGRRLRRPDSADTTQTEVPFVNGAVASYNSPHMRHMTMKPIFSLMGIACAQAA
jgi:hypothetical protein